MTMSGEGLALGVTGLFAIDCLTAAGKGFYATAKSLL